MSGADGHGGNGGGKNARKRPATPNPSTTVSSSDSEEEMRQTESAEQRKEPRMTLSNKNDQEETSVSEKEENPEDQETPKIDEQEAPAVEEQRVPSRDSLLIKPLTQKEREVLSRKLDPIEMEALIKQFNTDDEIVRIGHRYNKLIKCSVHISTAMSTVLFQVPEYETVKFTKRRLVKYGLGKGVFLSSIDTIYLEVQSDNDTGIETMIMPETNTDMLECFLYNLGFRAGNQYKIRMAFKSNKGDQAAEQDLIEDAKKRDTPNAITDLPLNEDPQIKMYQMVLQSMLDDDVEYKVLSSTKPKVDAKSSEATQRSKQSQAKNSNRYGTKWTQERLSTFIEYVTKGDFKKSVYIKGKELMVQKPDLFPVDSENRKQGFVGGDFRDKWTNIIGSKTVRGFFNRKTAKCDRHRLSQTRTLVLEEHQIQMIEEYLKTQDEYEKPETPE